jgi:pyrimidine oxygenase
MLKLMAPSGTTIALAVEPSVAGMLDEAARVPGTKGIMLTFDDFLIGMEQFGQRIQPLMATRRARLGEVA